MTKSWLNIAFSLRNKTSPSDLFDPPRRSGRKREDKSYVESPDIVIEEDYISKPSPAKKPNLGGHGREKENPNEKTIENEMEIEPTKKAGQTNGIEMESDDEDTEDENLPPVPSVQVRRNIYY